MSHEPPHVAQGYGGPPHAEFTPVHEPSVNAIDKWCVALSIAVLVVDAAIGMFCFSFMLCPFLAIVAVVRSLTAQRTKRPAQWSVAAVIAGVVAPTLAIAALFGNAAYARSRAPTVIAAVEAFHAHEGRWPSKLNETVPTYMPSVPNARLALSMSDFEYFLSPDGGPQLMFVVIPPFGRQYYVFEQKRWGSMD
jgi:hypothetical protein